MIFKSKAFIAAAFTFFMVLAVKYGAIFRKEHAAGWLVNGLFILGGLCCFIACMVVLFYHDKREQQLTEVQQQLDSNQQGSSQESGQ